MKTMTERMMDATDLLIAKEHPYEDKHHVPEEGMAVYVCKDEIIFCHVMQVDKWHDMETEERKLIEEFMQKWMLEQEEIPLGKMTLALAEFVVKDSDKALVRIEFNSNSLVRIESNK